jgi:hypothetical protein
MLRKQAGASLLSSVWATCRLGVVGGALACGDQIVLEFFLLGVRQHGRATGRWHVVNRGKRVRLFRALRGALGQATGRRRHVIGHHAAGRTAGKNHGCSDQRRRREDRPRKIPLQTHHARSTPAGRAARRRPALPFRGETAVNSSNCAEALVPQYDESKVNNERRDGTLGRASARLRWPPRTLMMRLAAVASKVHVKPQGHAGPTPEPRIEALP